MKIRPITQADLPSIKALIDESGLFPSELLDGMVEDFFSHPAPHDMWFAGEIGTEIAAVAYCAPEKMTLGTYNLYLIAVHPRYQGKKCGSQMIDFVEATLQAKQARILIVETSGLPEFEKTRAFYLKMGFTQEAVIREFFEPGDDKVVFWKKL